MERVAKKNAVCDTSPDPLINKILRTATGRIIQFKQSAQGCSLHAIHDERANFLYAPVPKAACTSICASIADYFQLNEHHTLRNFPRSIHKYFFNQPQYWIRPAELENLPHFKFTVVRNPIDRFISGYRNRVLDNRDLHVKKHIISTSKSLPEFPDMNFFALHLKEYCELNKKINWHFRPQAAVICNPSAYDRIYDISELDMLYTDISERCGVEFIPHRRNTSRAPTPDRLSQKAERALLDFYRIDFESFTGIIRPFD